MEEPEALESSTVIGGTRDADAEEVGAFVHGEAKASSNHFKLRDLRCLGKECELFSSAELGLRFHQAFFRGHP